MPTGYTPHYNLSSPMYLPYGGKGYPIFKESPLFHLNFMNSQGSTMNAHIYNGQATGHGGYNSEAAYPSASSNNNNNREEAEPGSKPEPGN
jgi:hypothetical protein